MVFPHRCLQTAVPGAPWDLRAAKIRPSRPPRSRRLFQFICILYHLYIIIYYIILYHIISYYIILYYIYRYTFSYLICIYSKYEYLFILCIATGKMEIPNTGMVYFDQKQPRWLPRLWTWAISRGNCWLDEPKSHMKEVVRLVASDDLKDFWNSTGWWLGHPSEKY